MTSLALPITRAAILAPRPVAPASPPTGATFAHLSTGSFVGSAAAIGIAVPKPATFADGDLLIAMIGSADADVTVTGVPAGWALAIERAKGTNYMRIYWKLAASEPASWTWTVSVTAGLKGVAIAYGGAPGIALDGTSGADSTVDNVVIPSITATTNNTLLIATTGQGGGRTYTAPASMTARATSNGTPGNFSMIVCDEIDTSAGATGTRTISGTSMSSPGIMAAFRG